MRGRYVYVGTHDRPPRQDKSRKSRRKLYVAMDLHKDTIQMAVRNRTGKLETNTSIPNTIQDIDEFFLDIPKTADIVMESSCVSRPVFLHLRNSGYDPILSNPYRTKAIAYNKIKTDRVDAEILSMLLHGKLIPQCHVPPKEVLDPRNLIRHRKHLTAAGRTFKRRVHAVLLNDGIRIEGTPFSKAYVERLRDVGDYRIDDCLEIIDTINGQLERIDCTIRDAVRTWPDESPRLLLTIPGIGPYTALLIAEEIGDISRFPDSHHLCSYAGLVPSTHSSGDTTYHGHITKRGNEHIRTAMVACVQSHRIGHPDGHIAAFYSRIAARHGNSKAMVATASKLLRVVYWVLKVHREYSREPPGRA